MALGCARQEPSLRDCVQAAAGIDSLFLLLLLLSLGIYCLPISHSLSRKVQLRKSPLTRVLQADQTPLPPGDNGQRFLRELDGPVRGCICAVSRRCSCPRAGRFLTQKSGLAEPSVKHLKC